jgi:hypothetical protein
MLKPDQALAILIALPGCPPVGIVGQALRRALQGPQWSK